MDMKIQLIKFFNSSLVSFVDNITRIDIKPVKIILHQIDDDVCPGEYVRVLPRYVV